MKWVIGLLCLMIFLSACSKEAENEVPDMPEGAEIDKGAVEILEEPETAGEIHTIIPQPEEDLALWENTELTDVNTGETFRIADFRGQKVLLESFAVWCPKCLKQQEILAELEDDSVHIALNTDPNEEESLVKTHTLTYGFDWRFSISPTDVTQSLIDEFGLSIVSAPTVPMILICEDGSRRMLDKGIKLAETLSEELALGC